MSSPGLQQAVTRKVPLTRTPFRASELSSLLYLKITTKSQQWSLGYLHSLRLNPSPIVKGQSKFFTGTYTPCIFRSLRVHVNMLQEMYYECCSLRFCKYVRFVNKLGLKVSYYCAYSKFYGIFCKVID